MASCSRTIRTGSTRSSRGAPGTRAETATGRERRYSGFYDQTIAAWLPEAAEDPEGDSDDVTVRHALGMATGNYRLSSYNGDENSVSMNDFFLPVAHAAKVGYAVSRFPRAAQPGTEMHYHTTDTYLSGYGGITIALIPNGAVYYYFSDGNSFVWDRAFSEIHAIRNSRNTGPLNPPTGLTAPTVTESSITLRWNPSADPIGVIHYRVYRDGLEIAVTSGDAASDHDVRCRRRSG